MAADELGPVPPGVVAGADGGQLPSALIWLNRVSAGIQRLATTALAGRVRKAAVVADLDQTVSATPTQAEVQAISDKVDELLAAQRAAGQMES